MELRRQGIINSSPHLVSLSDSGIVSFDTDMKSKVKECTVHFSPVQAAGTPAPDNVLPISGWTGVDVYRTGITLWDEEWEVGSYTNLGIKQSSSERIRNKNIMPIEGGIQIYFHSPNQGVLFFYDENKSFISYLVIYPNTVVTIPDGVKWFNFYMATKYGTVYNNDLSFNYPSTDTDYHPYSGATYSVTFPAQGKNLWDENSVEYAQEHTYIGGSNGVLATTVSDIIATKGFIPCSHLQGETVTLNKRCGGSGAGIAFYSQASESAFISGYANGGVAQGTPWTFQIPQNANYMRLTLPLAHTEIQLELGSTATSYEPYTNTIYGGYVDLVSGELTATWLGKKISAFAWSYSTYNSANAFRTDPLDLLGNSSEQGVMCSAFASEPMVVNYASSENKPNHTIYRLYTSVERRIFIKCTEYTSVSDFLTTYGDEEIAYKLATPVTYQLTPQQLSVFKGTNNVWSNTNGVIDLSFWAHKEPNGGLPLEYRRVEYLESSGTQYIKTNFAPSADDISVDWDYMQTETISGDQMMFGVRNGNGGSVYAELYANDRWYAQALKAVYNNVSAEGGGNSGRVNNIKYHSSMTQASFDINGYSFPPSTVYNKLASKMFYIFAWNGAGDRADYLANGLRLYNLTIRENGRLAANFIPCVRKSDNKPGMYDTVSHTFYTNAGTGEFTVPNN